MERARAGVILAMFLTVTGAGCIGDAGDDETLATSATQAPAAAAADAPDPVSIDESADILGEYANDWEWTVEPGHQAMTLSARLSGYGGVAGAIAAGGFQFALKSPDGSADVVIDSAGGGVAIQGGSTELAQLEYHETIPLGTWTVHFDTSTTIARLALSVEVH